MVCTGFFNGIVVNRVNSWGVILGISGWGCAARTLEH